MMPSFLCPETQDVLPDRRKRLRRLHEQPLRGPGRRGWMHPGPGHSGMK